MRLRAGFNDNLTLGGPVPIGARKANLSAEVQAHMEEIALNEQAHALFVRQVRVAAKALRFEICLTSNTAADISQQRDEH